MRKYHAYSVICVLAMSAAPVCADLIATDHFLRNAADTSNPNLSAGEYVTTNSINYFRRRDTLGGGQNPDVLGFNGAWSGTISGTVPSANYVVSQWTAETDPIVATQGTAYQAGGRARFGGNSGSNTVQRRVQRQLSTYTPSNAYYFSLTSQALTGDLSDASTPGFVGIGFTGGSGSTNGTVDDAYYTTGNAFKGFLIGVYNDEPGAATNSNPDYVIRHVGSTGTIQNDVIENDILQGPVGTTEVTIRYTVVRLDFNDDPTNPAGNSKLTIWQNPDANELYSEAAASAVAAPLVFRTFALGSASDITQLTMMGLNWSRPASFDEPRMGTTWGDAVIAPENTWITDADGTFSTATNWSYGTAPSGAGVRAALTTAVTAARTVTLDAPTTLGSLSLRSPNGYAVVGASTLTFAGTSTSLIATAGSNSLSVPIEVTSNFTASVSAGATLTVGDLTLASGTTGSIGGLGSFVSTGTLTSLGTLNVQEGAPTLKKLTGGGIVNVASNATLAFSAPAASEAVTLDAGLVTLDGAMKFTPAGPGVHSNVAKLTGLVLNATGSLDIGSTAIVIDAPGTLANLVTEISEGYNGGTWDGAGITSSSLPGAPSLALGIANAADVNMTAIGANAVPATAIVIRLTLKGDANLDGNVNFDDLLALAQNYGGSDKAWYQGNFDYVISTGVDFNDLLALAQNYGQALLAEQALQLQALDADLARDWALAQALVPEPTSLAAVALLMPLRRRRV